MKNALFSQIKLTRLQVLSFFSLTLLLLSLSAVWQLGHAQAQLSLADILIGLRSKKVTLPERNKLLTDAVKTRGITFSLTPEIEKELLSTGADKDLVDAIRQRSPILIVPSTPTPKILATPTPTPTPMATPVALVTPTPAPTPDFTFYRKRGDESISKGEFDLAVGDYSKAIELNPKDTSAYLNRGLAFYKQKSYDRAVSDYDKVIELNPSESMVYFNRGDSYEKMGEIQKAIVDYQKAIDLDGNNLSARNNLKRLQDEQAKSSSRPKEVEKPIVAPPANPAQIVELGQLNGYALKLATPAYPQLAEKMKIQGLVTVQITFDEEGKVTSAKAVSGPGVLRAVCEDAAERSRFKPTMVNNKAVKSSGYIVYNFKAS